MIGALWTGISGLGGSQAALDNESNNISNVNTIGYKASRVSFADQMYQDKVGKGVTSFDVEKMYTQGNLKLTGVSYDMALSGDGFFQVKNGKDTFYTRAGNFRMGESGKLEDVGQNNVQGWSIQKITADDITSTDSNVSAFSKVYDKLLGNKIIRDTTTVETIVAKSTDYTSTAVSDVNSVFTGASYKSASTKIADVEALITEYNSALTVYSEANPKPTASTSSVQKDLMVFSGLDDDDDASTNTLADGDEIYAYIDGVKYSQSFDTDDATTMKKFCDVLSNTPGFKAYVTSDDDTSNGNELDTQTAPQKGYIVIEGLIPGKNFSITEFGWTDASNDNQATKGETKSIQTAQEGTGMGHIESIKDALAEAVSGKQMDVYDNLTPDGDKDYTYQVEIYDKELKKNVKVPASALDITDPDNIDDIRDAINNDADLSKYLKAYNINGNLVVKTLDKNYDVEFAAELKEADTLMPRDPNKSGREGAAAEFLEIKTTINQTASKGDLQLRLDTLGLTDSAFGDFNVDNSGLITMQQDGAMFAIGQVAVARFTDNRGLAAMGDNLLKETTRSGSAIFNVNNDKMAEIKGGSLELSTADLSESLVNLMVFQRAFEANAKSITTADQILTTLIQLKR